MESVTRCVAHRCSEPAGSSGLCRRHRRRLETGGGLPTANELAKGDPSGHGQFMILDVSELGVLCHECGQRFAALGNHARRSHSLTADQYRAKHGIEGSLALRDRTGRRRPHPCSRCGEVLTSPAKLCDRCRAHRLRKKQQQPARRPRWRPLTEAERMDLVKTSADALAPLITRLQEDRVPSRAIGEVIGLSARQMASQFPRPGWGRGRRG